VVWWFGFLLSPYERIIVYNCSLGIPGYPYNPFLEGTNLGGTYFSLPYLEEE